MVELLQLKLYDLFLSNGAVLCPHMHTAEALAKHERKLETTVEGSPTRYGVQQRKTG